ncbi:MAG TPA: HEPN domain-containing protein [Kiritimatiellia bacterium]|jgi:HEPN domain-containing protein|nr:HEPN domain-containing protein [Kiritimatiellia bacterium]MBP9572573.1 HEPN domain-containing protein [Kiritimatiellia bacterium]HQF20779.1 HEPN domain-containing protein [Kiritimatiellia bacterium]HQG74901.1 HEPN domain-containing protein [Kiritimatiellia bacterium]
MSKKQQSVKSWLKKADADWRAMLLLVEAGPGMREITLFHAQQAVEKWLKALMVYHGQKPLRTHDLLLLLNAVLSTEPELKGFAKSLQHLNPFAVGGRYPGRQGPPSLRDTRSMVNTTAKIRDVILTKVTRRTQQRRKETT